jgi:CubicO group peptidase (beta-lactamase class C family)
LLAEVVSNASGMSLADFLEQRVFAPLELTMTLDPIYDGVDRAVSYESNIEVEANWLQVGDGAIHSTPTQLVLWADNYRTGTVGGDSLLAAQTADAVDTGYGSLYGAGIEIAPDGSLSHVGGWAGYVTLFGISADRSTAIAVMCNSVDTDAGAIAEDLRSIWAP